MTIYNIFDYAEAEKEFEDSNRSSSFYSEKEKKQENYIKNPESKKDAFLSAVFARIFFLCLLFADIFWGIYSASMLALKLSMAILTFFQSTKINQSLKRSVTSVKRSIVCFLALLIAIISPALGIMFSCMYFLMYDKKGVEEIVPSSLKSHFQEILPHSPFN